MPAKHFLRLVNGVLRMVAGVQTSAGAANAGDIPALDETGRLDATMMPVGIGADTSVVQASEALAANDMVNIWNSGGAARVRKADASVEGKHAHGFVTSAVASGAAATVFHEGRNAGLSGLTPGDVYLSTTPGQVSNAPPVAAGQVVQRVGVATSATEVNFEAGVAVTLA